MANTSDIKPKDPIVCQQREAGAFCDQDVHAWFELSYSSYLVLPRTLMQEMPAAWQHAMVGLLERMREEFPNSHDEYMVMLRGEHGRFRHDPLMNYRYPDRDAIATARGASEKPTDEKEEKP